MEASFENDVSQLSESALLKRMFNRESPESSGHRWGFFDDILLKCVANGDSGKGDISRADRLACVLVAVCLSDHDDFLRFIFDVFSKCNTESEKDEMTILDYATVLRTILPSHVKTTTFDENVNEFKLYLSSQSETIVFDEKDDVNQKLVRFPKLMALQYHTKVHQQLLWPLKVALQQVKAKFLGVNFWSRLQRNIGATDELSLYDASEAPNFSFFVACLTKLFANKQNITKVVVGPPDNSSPVERMRKINELNGIYTYRQGATAPVAKKSPRGRRPGSPIQHILDESNRSTEARRFPRVGSLTVSVGRSSVSSLHKELVDATRTMVGLKILIIEDSTTQRKMMHRKISHSSVNVPKDESCFNFVPVDDVSDESEGKSESKNRDEDEGSNWSVVEACNGEEAIQMIIDTKSNFDVIFVDEDLQSSGGYMLGHEFVKILREHDSVSATTVIVGCSANAQENAASFLESGADAVWKKPLPPPDAIYSELCKYIVTRSK